jgi:agmatinase
MMETDFEIAILGVPYDEGMPFMTGTRFGPRGLREQSLRYNNKGYYDFDDAKIYL